MLCDYNNISEFDVQAELYRLLKNAGYKVRGEVRVNDNTDSKYSRHILDLVVFLYGKPSVIIETKRKEGLHYEEQIDKYKRVVGKIPILICEGMGRVEETLLIIDKLCGYKRFNNRRVKKKDLFVDKMYNNFMSHLVLLKVDPGVLFFFRKNKEDIKVCLCILYSAFLKIHNVDKFEYSYLDDFIGLLGFIVNKKGCGFWKSDNLWACRNFPKLCKLLKKFSFRYETFLMSELKS